jgi:hypothetical protein
MPAARDLNVHMKRSVTAAEARRRSKVYAAWVAGADKKAAEFLASRLPRLPQMHDEPS